VDGEASFLSRRIRPRRPILGRSSFEIAWISTFLADGPMTGEQACLGTGGMPAFSLNQMPFPFRAVSQDSQYPAMHPNPADLCVLSKIDQISNVVPRSPLGIPPK
jgi:hypothetical protein